LSELPIIDTFIDSVLELHRQTSFFAVEAFFTYRRATTRHKHTPSEGPDWLTLFEKEA
jgi:hypothetical protein